MDQDTKELLKVFWLTGVGVIVLVFAVGIIFGLPTAYYQSQITGYSIAQCFWAGESIKTIELNSHGK